MKLSKAKLIKRKTDDGFFELKDHLKTGIVYEADLDSIQVVEVFNKKTKVTFKKEVIYCLDGQWFPTEMLKFER